MTPLVAALIQLAAQYGIPLVVELLQNIENGKTPTAADLQALQTKYASQTAAQILAAQEAALNIGTPSKLVQ